MYLSGAPYGYRYISKHEGGGEARYEIIEEQARVVQQMFAWIGIERCSIGEVCRRLKKGSSGKSGCSCSCYVIPPVQSGWYAVTGF